MKKYDVFISSLTATLLSLLASIVMATPTQHVAILFCPHVDVITHFENQIGGYGSESIMDQINRPIFFHSSSLPDGIPLNLGNYSNSATNYESTEGVVSCYFKSHNVLEPNFSLSYLITNGKGGEAQFRFPDSISILIPLGIQGFIK